MRHPRLNCTQSSNSEESTRILGKEGGKKSKPRWLTTSCPWLFGAHKPVTRNTNNEVIVNYWKPYLSKEYGHISILIPSLPMECNLACTEKDFEKLLEKNEKITIRILFNNSVPDTKPTYLIKPNAFYFCWSVSTSIVKQQLIYKVKDCKLIVSDQPPKTADNIRLTPDDYDGSAIADVLYVRYLNELHYVTYDPSKEHHPTKNKWAFFITKIDLSDNQIDEFDRLMKPTRSLRDLSHAELGEIARITGHHEYFDQNSLHRRKLAELHQALKITSFQERMLSLDAMTQALITQITGHSPEINMTFRATSADSPITVFCPFEMEDKFFRFDKEGVQVSELHQVTLYTLDIEKMKALFDKIYKGKAAEKNSATDSPPVEYSYATWWLGSVICVPFKQCFGKKNTLAEEILNDKKSNCAKMAMAEFEAGGMHQLLPPWYLSKKIIAASILLAFSVAAIVVTESHHFSTKFIQKIVYDAEISSIFLLGFLTASALSCLIIACCRGFHGRGGGVSTPQGVYEVALAMKAEEQRLFSNKANQETGAPLSDHDEQYQHAL